MDHDKNNSTVQTRSVKNDHRLFVYGSIASVTYVAGLAVYAVSIRYTMLKMTPDQFATFLSGIFAPLAFLWLVLGFRQQGSELRNSARALWLQGEELRNSVEQQRRLVEVSREQLEAEYNHRMRSDIEVKRAAQPQLIVTSNGGSYSGPKRELGFTASNAGPMCSAVKIMLNGTLLIEKSFFEQGGSISFFQAFDSPEQVRPLAISIHYIDNRGEIGVQDFIAPVLETGGPNKDRTLGDPVKVANSLVLG